MDIKFAVTSILLQNYYRASAEAPNWRDITYQRMRMNRRSGLSLAGATLLLGGGEVVHNVLPVVGVYLMWER